MKVFLSSYNISRTATNVAILTYGEKVQEVLALRDGVSKDIVDKRLDGVYQTFNGPRATSVPLQLGRAILNKGRVDRRLETSPQVILVAMGDNSETDNYRLGAVSSQLQRGGIRLIVLAIGLDKPDKLKNALQEPTDIIIVNKVEELKKKLGELEKASGKAARKMLFCSMEFCFHLFIKIS